MFLKQVIITWCQKLPFNCWLIWDRFSLHFAQILWSKWRLTTVPFWILLTQPALQGLWREYSFAFQNCSFMHTLLSDSVTKQQKTAWICKMPIRTEWQLHLLNCVSSHCRWKAIFYWEASMESNKNLHKILSCNNSNFPSLADWWR